MFKKYKTFLLILSCFAIFTACEKEYSVENGVPGGGGGGSQFQGSFRAKIDGVQWTANRNAVASKTSGIIVLRGLSLDGKSITLTVKDSGVHNYQFSNVSASNYGSFIDSSLAPLGSIFSTNQWVADSTYGSLNITSIDDVRKTMSGTFRIYVIRSLDGLKRNITEGVFTSISYGTPTTPPTNPPAGTDSFTVKVDGVEFMENSFSGVSAMGSITFSAINSAGSMVSVTLPQTVTPGTYPITLTGPFLGQYYTTAPLYLMSESGSIVVTEHNTTTHRITATFNFNAIDITSPSTNFNLTEGSFSGTYN